MINLSFISKGLLAVLLIVPFKLARGDIQIAGFDASVNDRFTNSPLFIANGFDVSGIGQDSGGKWATLISPNVVVSADHLQPSGNISFFAGNDPALVPVVRTIIQSQRISGTDLWVAKLNTDVDASIKPFGFATETLTGPPAVGDNITIADASIYQGLNGFVVGRSPTVHAANQDQAFGRNIITGYAEDIVFESSLSDTLVLWLDEETDADFVTNEALVIGGDSGAPFFVEQNGQLKLLGINSFQLQDDLKMPVASGISYIGNSATQIQQFINVAAVPEPGFIFLIGSFALGIYLRKRAAAVA